MVFRGQPSKACETCRVKRRKCDRVVPSCTQCIRQRQPCPGYKDPLDATFRNQTEATKERVHKTNSPSSTTTKYYEKRSTPDMFDYPIGSCISQAAISEFWNRIVGIEHAHNSWLPNELDFLYPVYDCASAEGVLTDLIKAFGLSAIAHEQEDQWLTNAARAKYIIAVQRINKTLQDLLLAKSDEVMAAVLLLSFFELRQCQSPTELLSWRRHILGAEALLSIRGDEQFSNPAGLKMFTIIRKQMLISTFETGDMFPADLREMSNIARQFEDVEQQAASDLLEICCQFGDVWAAFKLKHGLVPDREMAISMLISIDESLCSWSNTLPPEYQYSVVESPSSEYVYLDHYHQYSTTSILSTWNRYRSIRILVLQMLHHLLQQTSPTDNSDREFIATCSGRGAGSGLLQEDITRWHQPPVVANSSMCNPILRRIEASIQDLREDLCSCIPWLLNFSDAPASPLDYDIPVDSAKSSRSMQPTFSRVILVVWITYLAGGTDFSVPPPPSMTCWITMQLRAIGRNTSMNQANIMAELLDSGADNNTWLNSNTWLYHSEKT